MFEFKNKFKMIYICLIIFIGFIFILNNHQVMAMNDYNNLTDSNLIENKIYELDLEINKLVTKVDFLSIYDVDITGLQQQLYNLDQKIKILYQKLSIVNTLKDIKKQIYNFSCKKKQIDINNLSCGCLLHPNKTIEEINNEHQENKLTNKKINNLRQIYINLQYKLNNLN
ncbi:SVM family protein ['Fragaria x ananassa' phyllody phytoplasma]|uniref:SVM family protein n=1 Tax='Fragaria x ananassa' phyllody phytoplasma TaxID=2358428 RepID=A0ABS5K353_9MOLU|nr:SVM family protein ['Fragaria x ananassa' phyllody phytoplasma]MBS2126297.1 SVM family protein ['Fragaria x ananassa' phyllody phytoplasma]